MCVYVALLQGADRVKIGYSKGKSPWKRINSLEKSTSCPGTLKVLAIFSNGSRETEAYFHKLFKKDRVKGEWFVYSHAIQKFVKDWRNLQEHIRQKRNEERRERREELELERLEDRMMEEDERRLEAQYAEAHG